MNKLKEKIFKIIHELSDTGPNENDVTDQILTAFSEALPKEIRLQGLKKKIKSGEIRTATEVEILRNFDVPFRDGWNDCLAEIKKSLSP